MVRLDEPLPGHLRFSATADLPGGPDVVELLASTEPSRNRSLFLENREYAVFDLSRAGSVVVRVHASELSGRILHGRSLMERRTRGASPGRPCSPWAARGGTRRPGRRPSAAW